MPPILAVAVSSRYKEHNLDYNWYIQNGDFCLFEKVKNIYKDLLRDRQGDAPRIVCNLDKQHNRIGLLIAEIQSSRQDYVGRIIRNTIYFELNAKYKKEIFNAVSALLLMEFNEGKYDEKIISPILNYAEKLLKCKDDAKVLADLLEHQDIKLPAYDELKNYDIESFNTNIKNIALFSTLSNRKKLARYLINDIAKQKSIQSSFVLVSSARVNIDQITKFADKIYIDKQFEKDQHLIILTLSESVPKNKGVNLRNFKKTIHLRSKKTLIGKSISQINKIGGFFGIIIFFFIVNFYFQDRDKPYLVGITAGSTTIKIDKNSQIPLITISKTLKSIKLKFNEPLDNKMLPQMIINPPIKDINLATDQCVLKNDMEWDCPLSINLLDFINSKPKNFFNIHITNVHDTSKNIMKTQNLHIQLKKNNHTIASKETPQATDDQDNSLNLDKYEKADDKRLDTSVTSEKTK